MTPLFSNSPGYDLDSILAVRLPVSFQTTRYTHIRKQVELSKRRYKWLPDYPLLQGSPTLTLHENHLGDLLSQIAGSHF